MPRKRSQQKTPKKNPNEPKLPRLTRDFVINKFDITDPYWSHITQAQAVKIANAMHKFAMTNMKGIDKAGLFSPAEEIYRKSGGKFQPVKSNTIRASAILELARLQQFLQSKTSTAKGIREVNMEQDKRIFGINPKTGRAKHRMTEQQRRDFWSAYDEFTNGSAYQRYRHYNSNVIQQALFSVGLNRRHFTAEDFEKVIKRLPEIQRMYEEDSNTFRDRLRSINWHKVNNRNKTVEDIMDERAAVRTGRRTRKKD